MPTRRLVWASFIAWAIGVVILATTFWLDANNAGPHDDVGAGLAGLAVLMGIAIASVLWTIGASTGIMATRRAPDDRPPSIALGLNVITLFGVLLSTVALFFL